MKICTQCDQTYHDNEQNFCLMDGTPLVDGASQPTVAISLGSEETQVIQMQGRPTVQTTRRRGFGFWVAVTGACIAAVVGAMIGGLFLYFMFNPEDEAANRNRDGVNTASKKIVAKRTPTPMVAPTVKPSPTPDGTATTPEDDEVVPIAWTTSAVEFRGEDGDTYTFECPESGTASAVWGSDVYAGDSSICTAAVHAGVITLAQGGQVVIEFRLGRTIYGSTTRNGITSNTFGEYNRSFIVR